jgi:glycerophosphoryl diester phosphodiesterase
MSGTDTARAELIGTAGGTARPEVCRDPAQAARFSLRGKGFRIPTLSEVLRALPRTTPIAIEVKEPGFETEICQLLRASGRAGQLIVGSGRDEIGERLQACLPSPLAAHYFPKWAAMRLAAGTGLAQGHLTAPAYQIFAAPTATAGLSLASARFIATLHKQGLWAMYFIIDEADEMKRLFDQHADAIITDFPGLARKVRDRGSASP